MPQHDKSRVQLLVETGDGASHTIGFGKTGGLPKAVFGKVEEAAATDDNFPHAVIAVNNDTAATGDTAAFTVKGDDLFKNTWEKLVKRQDCLAKLSWPIRLALYIFWFSRHVTVIFLFFIVSPTCSGGFTLRLS